MENKNVKFAQKSMDNLLKEFQDLVKVIHELRVKCPWDREQTIHSIRPLTIEETYELSEEIIKENYKGIKEELGDLLLHIILYSRIAEEQGKFNLQEVLKNIREKLIRRHPHVYGTQKLNDSKSVIKNWEKLKQKEKKRTLSGVPKSMPSLLKALRIQQKAAGVGFDWEETKDIKDKILEEINELENAKSQQQKEEEFGDLIFALVNYARRMNINPETALEKTNLKFIERFNYMEDLAEKQNKKLSELSLNEQENLWQSAKK